MRKLRRRIFAAVLAAFMIVTAMPVTALYASAETGSVSGNAAGQAGTEDIEENGDGDTEETETDDSEGTGDSDTEEPAQEPPAGPPEEDAAKCICETLCTEDNGNNSGCINGNCPVCGVEGADLSACKGKEQGSVPEIDTGEKTEEQEKTGEKVITAWEWIDPEEYLTDGMLALPGAGRENPAFAEDVTALLPEKIQAEVVIVNAAEDGEETEEDAEAAPETEGAEITLTGWECASYPEDGAYEGTYTFTASLPGGFVLAEDAAALKVEVELGGAKVLAETVSASYQEASWNGSAVTYATQTAESCTVVESSTTAVTWTEGWYVVSGTVTISEPITVNGAVHLILADGCTLTASKGIVVTTDNSLTIYAQSDGTGTLNATGTTDSDNNASAGIGGSTETLDSGSITIHGGVINVAGGYVKNMNGSGAGIGGGGSTDGNGGDSGAITIYNGVITAVGGELDYDKKIATYFSGAGIGGGSSRNNSGGAGSSITIYGGDVTATSKASNNGGAGIGGGAGAYNGGSGNITIRGGTVRATGGCIDMGLGGAGVGGGGSIGEGSGDGTVTIAGGKVTAVGGRYAAGIGGGGGYQYSDSYLGSGSITGGTGSVTISGGIVDASSPTDVDWEGCEGAPIGNGGNASGGSVEKTTGIVFENGVGTVCGNVTFNGSYNVPADYSLHIPAGNSLSGSGTLTGGGTFTTDLSEDMISVPEDWHYTGEDLTEDIKKAVSLNGDVTICGKTFTADTTGWELSVDKVSELEYTVKYTHSEKGTLSKTVTIAKGQPSLSDAAAYKADGTTPASIFGVGETIIIKATPAFPTNGAVMAAAFTEPAGEQMAVYYNDTQISAPSTVENGVHTMTVDTSNLPESALNKEIALTVKYIESGNASGADTEVKVTVTAVAKVVNGSSTTYVGALADAFTEGNSGATVTLLSEVDLGANYISIDNNTFTLDLNGQTVKATDYGAFNISGGSITIQDSGTGGKIESSDITIEVNSGTLSVKSGTVSGFCGVRIISGTVNISGGAISGDECGLLVDGRGSIALSGGTYNSKRAIMINDNASVSLKDMLATGYAYHQNDMPVTKAEGVVDGNIGEVPLDAKPALLTGTVTVKECNHTGEGVCEYTHAKGTTIHSQTCLACGDTKSSENCSFDENGKCPCGVVLAVTLPDNLDLTYTGTAQTPEVTVMVDGTAALAVNTDYSVAYDNNINAGNTAKVTVTGTAFTGTFTLPFTIKPTTPTLAWESTTQELTYTGNEAMITAPKATGVNGTQLDITHDTGPCLFSYTAQGGSTFTDGLPTNAGTYTVKASIEAKGNYTAAESTNTLTLTINRAQGTLTVPAGPVAKTFGDGQFLLGCSTNGDGKISYVSSDENVASVSADGNVLIKGAGEAAITVSLSDGTNYTGAESQEVQISVAKAAALTIPGETRNYTYLNGSHGAVTIDVAGKLPKDRGETTYTAATTDGKGILSGVSIDQDGNLVYTVEGNKSAGDTAVITVTAVMANYGDTAYAVTIELVEKKTVEPQNGGSVSVKDGCILTYGQTLSDLTLENVIFLEQGTEKQVEGTLAWSNPSHVPEVAARTAQWVFTPKDNKEYEQLTGTAAITVVKATPETEVPEAAAVTYHPAGTLGSVGLNGGGAAWTVGGSAVAVEGTWGWKEPSAIPAVKNSGYTAVFTPKDTANYDTVERTVAVTVAKAEPYIETPPTAAQITYGDALDASALTGGTVQYSSSDSTAVTGSFAWKDGSIKPDSGSAAYTVVFTPADSTDYSSVETQVTLVTGKAENAPDMPPSAMNVARRFEKVGDVGLPEGWQWQDTDRNTALEMGIPVTATAVYTGADRDNYRNVTVSVAITRADCGHEHTGTRNAVTATCQRKGYTGDTWCLDCGELLAKGTETDLADHSGGTATCISGKVCQVCGTEYTGKDSANHMHTEIRGAIKADCTSDGYTGDTYCTDCGAKTGSGRALPAAGHDWHVTREEAATATSEGRRIYTCGECGQTREESIPKLPQPSHTHSYSPRETKAATCRSNGVITYSCSCGDSYTQSTAALGHSYRSEVTKQPTVSTEGVMTYTCDRCGHSYTRPIAKLPGEDTTKPGTGQPGETGPGSGSTEARPETGIPFIKGGDGRTGWDVIRAEEEKAQEGSTINVDMNGTTVVPGDIFDSIKGKDITVTFDMGSGILWSVDGKSITTDKAGDIDFSVQTGVNTVPVDIVNNVTGESYSIQISLAHGGEFGFTAVLSIGLGKENAGYTASLYYYNESTGELEFICSDEVAQDGTVSLAFTHASDYVIAIDGDGEKESGNVTEPAQPDTPEKDSTESAGENPQNGQAWRPWWFIVVGSLVIVMGIGIFFAVRKKQETENS